MGIDDSNFWTLLLVMDSRVWQVPYRLTAHRAFESFGGWSSCNRALMYRIPAGKGKCCGQDSPDQSERIVATRRESLMNIDIARICCFAVLIAMVLLPGSLPAQKTQAAGKAADVESRRAQLLSLFDEEWQYELRSDPEAATSLGDNRYNDRLSDRSPKFYRSDEENKRKFLARFEAIDPAGLSAPGHAEPRVDDPKPASGH